MKNLYRVTRIIPLFICALSLWLIPSGVLAQSGETATGTVVDVNGNPIGGVSVLYGSQGTITDAQGTFQLRNIPRGSTLVFQFLGMHSVEAKYEGHAMQVTMRDDAISMDEVIVIGFGEQRRASFTGSAGVVTAEQLSIKPVNNIFDAVQGTVTGLQSISTSGSPGSTPEFSVRGLGSISASSTPMIVVDGAPYSGSWNSINPNDVESITVLKDAASNAIYGARGVTG